MSVIGTHIRKLAAGTAALWAIVGSATPVTYEQDTFIGAPGSASQLVYSPAYNAVVMRTTSAVRVMNVTTGTVSSFTPNSQFSDMSLTPDGRYVYVADYAFSGGRVGRIDLQTGTFESKPVLAVPYRIEATDADKFILTSEDQWIDFWRCGWGMGANVAILNSNPGGYYPSVYYGDVEYDRFTGRLIHGNNGSSSHEITAFSLIGDNFVEREGSGIYGSADAYGGSSVLATDASRFYYGRLQVLASDVRLNQLVFPTIIVAATGNDAFASGGTYYDAATATGIGSLGFPVSSYGLNANGADFWAYDPSTSTLRHFVPAGGAGGTVQAHADFAAVAQGYSANIDVAANDSGFADGVTVEIVTPPAHGTATVIGSPGDKAGVRIQYAAAFGYVGSDHLEYSITDGTNTGTARVGIDVAAAKAFNDSYVMLVNGYDSLYVARNDVGFGSQVSLSIVTYPLQGYASTGSSPGPRNSVYISYNPAYNRPAPYTETITYQISDGSHTDTAVASIRVVDYEAIDDELVIGADQASGIDVLANDLGFGYERVVGTYTSPLHGTVAFAGDSALYTPQPGYLGTDSFQYFVDDGTHVAIAKVMVRVITDTDRDQISDTVDNCLGYANADQRDSDADGFGNACDADLNNDLRVNFADLAIFRVRFSTTDADADFDGSGSVNFPDLGRFRALFGRVPGPSATVP